jgi:hypothetical protein
MRKNWRSVRLRVLVVYGSTIPEEGASLGGETHPVGFLFGGAAFSSGALFDGGHLDRDQRAAEGSGADDGLYYSDATSGSSAATAGQ